MFSDMKKNTKNLTAPMKNNMLVLLSAVTSELFQMLILSDMFGQFTPMKSRISVDTANMQAALW